LIALELEEDTRTMLTCIRAVQGKLRLDDVDSDLAEQAVVVICRPLLDAAGLRLCHYNQFRWFLRELARVLRTRSGWELAYDIEELLRKWTRYGLDPALLQRVVREAYRGLVVPEVQP